jgi:hypothetical protein
MRSQSGWLLALALCALLLASWALSGVTITSAVCKGTQQLTIYRGPFSSLCLSIFISDQSAGSRESI